MNENPAVGGRLFAPLISAPTEWALPGNEFRWLRRIDVHGASQHFYRFATSSVLLCSEFSAAADR
jgi:hypothetical protein